MTVRGKAVEHARMHRLSPIPVRTPTPTTRSNSVMLAPEWRLLAQNHRRRVEPWIAPRLQRRRDRQRHPVDDFLFDYYRLRPAQLAAWHPGIGVGLDDPTSTYRDHSDYLVNDDVAWVDTLRFPRRRRAVERGLVIMQSTISRSAEYSCFGMHEWAMVYGLDQSQVRHEQLPLRLTPDQVATVVDSVGLRCTHFDAYRFFTGPAARKQLPLSRASQPDDEQAACLHAGMDLYRYAYEAGPFLRSDLVADCFEHARRARQLDMRASPYDVSEFGLSVVPVETPAGRAQYVAAQKELAESAGWLRSRLIQEFQLLLSQADSIT
jgi:hypothetical protein